MLYVCRFLPWQTEDNIHINVIKADLPRKRKGLLRILYCVMSPDEIQGPLVHRLRIDGYPVDTVGFQDFKFLPGY